MFVLELSLLRLDFLPWRHEIARGEKWQQKVCFGCDTSKINNKTCWDTSGVGDSNNTDKFFCWCLFMLKKTKYAVRIKDGIGDSRRDFTLLAVWTPIWFSYKTFCQVLSAASRVMRIKYSALLALPCFTREVQHLRGRQLGNAAVARKEVMKILFWASRKLLVFQNFLCMRLLGGKLNWWTVVWVREQNEVMGRGSGCNSPVTGIKDLKIGFQVLVKVVRMEMEQS